MIEVITGAPGAGKTLRAIWLLEQPEYSGRPVYSNIPGSGHEPLPDGDDWRDTPEGSIVIYDEAQRIFPSSGRAGNSTDPRVIALETHRHTGHDLVFLTQRYTLIHHHIRGLAGRHTHLIKKTSTVSVVFAADEVFDPKDRARNRTISETVFRHPSHLFGKYQSSSFHSEVQTKRPIPLKLKALGVFMVALAVVSAYAFSTVSIVPDAGLISEESQTVTIAQVADPASADDPDDLPAWATPGLDGLSGCVSSETRCQCFDFNGLRVDLPQEVCRSEIDGPMISRIRGFDRRG